MPDRAKIISQLASKAKMDPSSAVKEKDVKAMGEILEPEGYGMMRKDKIKKIVEPLPTPKDKEAEVEDLLSESEMEMEKKAEDAAKKEANYARIENQKMSDQGIVNLDQLAAAGKKVYRKVKSKVKSMME
jgi:hypothetical protein